MTAYRQALQPFFERAGRGAAAIGCSDTDAEIAGRGKSCTCGGDMCTYTTMFEDDYEPRSRCARWTIRRTKCMGRHGMDKWCLWAPMTIGASESESVGDNVLLPI